MQPKQVEYLFEKIKRDASKLEEIQGLSSGSLAEIMDRLRISRDQGSSDVSSPVPDDSAEDYSGPLPVGKFYSRGVPVKALRDSPDRPRCLQFKVGQMLIMTEKST